MPTSIRPLFSLPPARARGVAVIVLTALPGGYLADAMLVDPAPALAVAIGVVKLIGLIGAIALFLDSHGQRANAPDRMLDERQRGERDRAHVRSYQIIVAAMFLVFLYTLPAKSLGWWFPDRDDGIDLLSAFAIGALALPGIILAWRARPAED